MTHDELSVALEEEERSRQNKASDKAAGGQTGVHATPSHTQQEGQGSKNTVTPSGDEARRNLAQALENDN